MVDLIRRLSATATTTLPDFLVSNMNESALWHPCARLNGLGPASTFGQAEANTPDLRPRLVPARFPIPQAPGAGFQSALWPLPFFRHEVSEMGATLKPARWSHVARSSAGAWNKHEQSVLSVGLLR